MTCVVHAGSACAVFVSALGFDVPVGLSLSRPVFMEHLHLFLNMLSRSNILMKRRGLCER